MGPAHVYAPFKHGHMQHISLPTANIFLEEKIFPLCVTGLSINIIFFFKEAWMMKDMFHIAKSSLPGLDEKSTL